MEHLTDAATVSSGALHLLLHQQVQELEWTAHSGMRDDLDERVGPPGTTQVDKFSPPREPHLEERSKNG